MKLFGRMLDRLAADVLRVDLRLAIGPDADQRIGLVDRMLLRNAIDGRRGNLHHPVAAELAARGEDVAAAVNLGREDVLFGVERKRSGAVNDNIAALDALLYRRNVAHVAKSELEPRFGLLRIVEVGYVEDTNFLHTLGAEETNEIDAEKARTACDEDLHRAPHFASGAAGAAGAGAAGAAGAGATGAAGAGAAGAGAAGASGAAGTSGTAGSSGAVGSAGAVSAAGSASRAIRLREWTVEVRRARTSVLRRKIAPRIAVVRMRTLPASAPRDASSMPPPNAPPRPPSFGF